MKFWGDCRVFFFFQDNRFVSTHRWIVAKSTVNQSFCVKADENFKLKSVVYGPSGTRGEISRWASWPSKQSIKNLAGCLCGPHRRRPFECAVRYRLARALVNIPVQKIDGCDGDNLGD